MKTISVAAETLRYEDYCLRLSKEEGNENKLIRHFKTFMPGSHELITESAIHGALLDVAPELYFHQGEPRVDTDASDAVCRHLNRALRRNPGYKVELRAYLDSCNAVLN